MRHPVWDFYIPEGNELLRLCCFLMSAIWWTGVESVEAGIFESNDQAFKVTKPAVLPSGLGDSSFNRILPDCFISSMLDFAVPIKTWKA